MSETDTTMKEQIKQKLRAVILEIPKLQQEIEALQSQFSQAIGKRDALAELFLDGTDMDLPAAWENNYEGLQDDPADAPGPVQVGRPVKAIGGMT